MVEETYHFTFPEDYFQFITKAANGGAGPDYGIMPFEDSLMSGAYGDFQEAYKRSLETPFVPRPMMLEEVESCSFAKAAYVQNPDKFLSMRKRKTPFAAQTAFLSWGPTDANGILSSSYPVSERGRYSLRTMKERIF